MKKYICITLGVLLIFCQAIFAENGNKIAYNEIDNSESLSVPKETAEEKTNLSELTFKELLSGSNLDKDEKFRGDFYPIRVFSMPGKLRKNGMQNFKMVMVNTERSNERLFVLFPAEKRSEVSKSIRYHKQMSIVYKRIGVFNTKYPLLKFVEKVKSE